MVNVAIGRLTFALGLAVAMAALAAARRDKTVLAAVLAMATAPASPVAGVALALALTAWWLHDRRPRLAVLAVLAAAPVGIAAVLFPQGGEFPFRGGAVAWSLAVAAIVGRRDDGARRALRGDALRRRLRRHVRRRQPARRQPARDSGCSPPHRSIVLTARRVRVPLVAIAVAAMLWWQWSPALDGIVRAGRDPSSRGRVPPAARRRRAPTRRRRRRGSRWCRRCGTGRRCTSPSRLPLARGWERQLDMGRNAVFYDTELEPGAYHAVASRQRRAVRRPPRRAASTRQDCERGAT